MVFSFFTTSGIDDCGAEVGVPPPVTDEELAPTPFLYDPGNVMRLLAAIV